MVSEYDKPVKPDQLSQQEIVNLLKSVYDREDKLKKELNKLLILVEQVREEKEMLQDMYMFQSNKMARLQEFNALKGV